MSANYYYVCFVFIMGYFMLCMSVPHLTHKKTKCYLSVGEGDPLWLLNIISSLQGAEASDEKALLAYLYIVMYETGFYFSDGPYHKTISYDVRVMRCLTDPQILLDHIKKVNSKYTTVFSHNLIYPKFIKVVSYTSAAKDIKLVINFLLANNNQTKSLEFPIKKYVSVEDGKVFFNADTRSELTMDLKNALYLLKGDLANETYHQHHIVALPLHILQELCFYLEPKSFLNFIATCKSLWRAFSEDEIIWKYYSVNMFRGVDKLKNETWKVHFKNRIEVAFIGKKIFCSNPKKVDNQPGVCAIMTIILLMLLYTYDIWIKFIFFTGNVIEKKI